MTEERDTAGFVLPFAIGTIVSLFLCRHLNPSETQLITLIGTIATGFFSLLTIKYRIRFSSTIIWTLAALIGLSAGIMTGSSGLLTDMGFVGGSAKISSIPQIFLAGTKRCITSLPFKNEIAEGLVLALITGDRSALTPAVTATFRDSGAAHILALSGLHLGIIYGALKAVLYPLGNSYKLRIIKALTTVSICGFYTLATGAGASITRAFLFILLGEAAQLTGRFRSTRTILWSALLIQLVIKPLEIHDIGFQLSYAAMAGIAYIYPYLNGFWPKENAGATGRCLQKIWSSAAMSIACQLTTGPLAWIYFGTFPQYFILTNLIALPLTGAVIPICLIAIILNALGCCPEMLVQTVDLLIGIMVQSLEIISGL